MRTLGLVPSVLFLVTCWTGAAFGLEPARNGEQLASIHSQDIGEAAEALPVAGTPAGHTALAHFVAPRPDGIFLDVLGGAEGTPSLVMVADQDESSSTPPAESHAVRWGLYGSGFLAAGVGLALVESGAFRAPHASRTPVEFVPLTSVPRWVPREGVGGEGGTANGPTSGFEPASPTPSSMEATVTPEPVSMMLLGTGLAGVAAARRRKRQK